jgi:hypothetical protein
MLVNVESNPKPSPLGDGLELVFRAGSVKPWLVNRTGRHVYVEEGYACPVVKVELVDCKRLELFTRQSMLPEEQLETMVVDAPWLGVLLRTNLNSGDTTNARALMVKVPPAVRKDGTSSAATQTTQH